jgi:molybdopterin molybdotransferase
MLTHEQARQTVIEHLQTKKSPRATTVVSVWEALGYVLAQNIQTDRAYPPFDRATRDGYAVRASDATNGADLRCAGEIKAGDTATTPLARWTCVQIMTGAALPPGSDAVVMLEHVQREGDNIRFDRDTRPGQNFVPRASEAKSGQVILTPGTRLGFAEVALAAQVGQTELLCAAKPRIAILSTGDEIVLVDQKPGPFQIRNSNSVSLAAQTKLAGGEPILLGNAPDRADILRTKIERGLREDVLVISGGVSMGKYDLVEMVLKDLGAEFFFDAVAIRPGKPAVFGRCRDTYVFGLPGNPISTMVTFELLVTAAIDLLNGAPARALPIVQAQLSEPVREKPGLTHFLPARVQWPASAPEVKPLPWQGSGDVAALARANCFLIVPPDREEMSAGAIVSILLRKDVV